MRAPLLLAAGTLAVAAWMLRWEVNVSPAHNTAYVLDRWTGGISFYGRNLEYPGKPYVAPAEPVRHGFVDFDAEGKPAPAESSSSSKPWLAPK